MLRKSFRCASGANASIASTVIVAPTAASIAIVITIITIGVGAGRASACSSALRAAGGCAVERSSPAAITGGGVIGVAWHGGERDLKTGRMARFLHCQSSAALIDRNIGARSGAAVKRQRPDEDIVGLLLQNLHGPAGDAADSENRNEKIVRNAVQMINGA